MNEDFVKSRRIVAGSFRRIRYAALLLSVLMNLAALPVAAVYPAIERIWLREKLPEETVVEHKRIEHRVVHGRRG